MAPVLDSRKHSGVSQADYTCNHMWTHLSLTESFMCWLKQMTRDIKGKHKESSFVDNTGFCIMMLEIQNQSFYCHIDVAF